MWNKKLACFYEPQFGRISLSISLSDPVLETKRLQAKELNSTCRTISVSKLLQNVNFDGLTFFDSPSLVQPIRLFEPF